VAPGGPEPQRPVLAMTARSVSMPLILAAFFLPVARQDMHKST